MNSGLQCTSKVLECKFKRSWPPFRGNKVLLRESVADGSTNRQERSFAWIGRWFIKSQNDSRFPLYNNGSLVDKALPTRTGFMISNEWGKNSKFNTHPLFLLSWVEKNTPGKWSSSFADNLHDALSIDETSLSSVALYTIVINNTPKGKKVALVAMVRGTMADKITDVLQQTRNANGWKYGK